MMTGSVAAEVSPPGPGSDLAADRRPQPSGGRLSAAVPVALGTFSMLLVAGGFSLGLQLANLHNGLIAAAFTAVGVFVLRARPGHPEGRLFVATGVGHAVMFFGRQCGLYGGELPAQAWLGWLGVWPLGAILALAGITMMCFPDGRLPSPGWRVAAVVMAVTGALLSFLSALWPVEYARVDLTVPHPLPLDGTDTAQWIWDVAGGPAYLLFQLTWVACVVFRLRRSEGHERHQLEWFAYAVTMGAAAMVLGLVVFGSPTLGALTVPFVAIAAGVAIVRHRLYDIDLVISKTLVIGVMAAIITAVYVVVVSAVGRLVGGSADPGLLLSVLATAVVAVIFEPVRRRVQRAADRLVYGHRPTPYEALARLSTQLRLEMRGDDLLTGMAATVADAVGAREVTLWLGPRHELVAVAEWPPSAEAAPPLASATTDLDALGGDLRTHVRPIVHQGTLRGAISLRKAPGDELAADDERLLADLVAQAGLVLDNVGLALELQRRLHQISVQAGELQAAVKRIVAAQDAARRRIERDLHDGAQQRLVTLALSLSALSERAGTCGDDRLAAGIEAARSQLSEAIAELREMARGIHPAILSQEGLEAALSFLAERSPVPVRVSVRLARRLSQEVEAAAYFVVSEALANAAKHADASRVAIAAELRDGALQIEVSDDGRGGAGSRSQGGLQGLTDRLATLDGRLAVDSPPAGGTTLRAEIPCA